MVYAHKHDRGFLESYNMLDHHDEKHVISDLGYNLTPRINTTISTPTTNAMFDVIDDVMAKQNTNGENVDEEGRGI